MEAVLRIEELTVAYAGETRPAVNAASVSIHEGEVLGVVGESGSGKSTLGFAALGLLPRSARLTGGSVLIDGAPPGRSRARMAYVPQDPLNALNPTLRVGKQLDLILRRKLTGDRGERTKALRAMLERLGIADSERFVRSYPFELSGGQVQRALLAAAFLTRPRLVLADEPTTALDVLVQADVLVLIQALARDQGVAILFISHNLGVVAGLCDRIAVMRGGAILEQGSSNQVIHDARHPYTRALLAALPERARPRHPIVAEVA